MPGLLRSRFLTLRLCARLERSPTSGVKTRHKQLKKAFFSELKWRQLTDANAVEYTREEQNDMIDNSRLPWSPLQADPNAFGAPVRASLYKQWHELCAETARTNEAIDEVLPREAGASLEALATFVEKIEDAIVTLSAALAAPAAPTPEWAALQAERDAKLYALKQARSRYTALRAGAVRLWTHGPHRETSRSREVPALIRPANAFAAAVAAANAEDAAAFAAATAISGDANAAPAAAAALGSGAAAVVGAGAAGGGGGADADDADAAVSDGARGLGSSGESSYSASSDESGSEQEEAADAEAADMEAAGEEAEAATDV